MFSATLLKWERAGEGSARGLAKSKSADARPKATLDAPAPVPLAVKVEMETANDAPDLPPQS
ncbi:MAG TPA: hypothetical protein VF766_09745 [Pyrinomonadaceae bacterium]